MTARRLAIELIHLKEELKDKEVKIMYPNGEIATFDIKFVLKDKFNLDKTKENVDYIILG